MFSGIIAWAQKNNPKKRLDLAGQSGVLDLPWGGGGLEMVSSGVAVVHTYSVQSRMLPVRGYEYVVGFQIRLLCNICGSVVGGSTIISLRGVVYILWRSCGGFNYIYLNHNYGVLYISTEYSVHYETIHGNL